MGRGCARPLIGRTVFQPGRNACFIYCGKQFIGLVVGALAKFLMPGKDPGGILLITSPVRSGSAGALLATFIGSHLGLYQEGKRAGFIMSLHGRDRASGVSDRVIRGMRQRPSLDSFLAC